VRVSAIITKPSRTRIPQQYVMGADFSVSNSVEVIAMRRNWAMLALRLLAGLAYLHRDLQRLAAAT